MRGLLACAVALTLLPGPAARAFDDGAPVPPAPTLEALRRLGATPVTGHALRDMIVGKAVLIEELATGERFEAIFFPSGVRILRPVARTGAERALQQRGLSSVASYTIAEDRLQFSADGQAYEFQIYDAGGTLYGFRLRDGRDVAGWRFASHDREPLRYRTVAELAERGIEPLDGGFLREIVAGHTLTLLRRSTGELFEVTFDSEGNSLIRDGAGTRIDGQRYTIFQNQLVTTIEGRPAYVTVYRTPVGFLAARSIDGGLLDWELLQRE